MEHTDDFLKKVTSMGTLRYSLKKCINILDVADTDERAFASDFDNAETKVGKAYQKGIDKADYAIDVKLFDLATKKGDLKALEVFERRRYEQLAHDVARKAKEDDRN
jgi:hypothetical protein